MLHRALPALPAALLLACAAAPPPAAPPPPPVAAAEPAAATPARAAAPEELPPIEYLHDDLPGALARARDQGKALFVDAWAPWCHTCLSMKHYVLDDPSLRPLADRVVFVALDTDKPENAAFVERYRMSVWPTFFMLDPADGQVVGLWAGGASVAEMREVLEEGARAVADRAGATRPPDHPDRILVEARRAQAGGEHAAAATAYERALAAGGKGWARRSDALSGRLSALYAARDHAACARFGREHVAEVKGAAVPADFASLLLGCARGLPADAEDRRLAEEAAIARLRQITREPPPGATPDDRADALGILASALKDRGDAAGAREALSARLSILEQAAREAKTPEMAATHDYARAMTYLELGRGEEAVAMLTEREKQLPALYEPPARLAYVLHKLGRAPEALAAVDRALARSYGPRRPRYLMLKADIQGKMGDAKAQAATLREELAAYEALPPAMRRDAQIADAKKRLAEAEKALAGKKR